MVMAETQRSPESHCDPSGRWHALWVRQDSAACVSLSSNHLSKSTGASTTIAARLAPARRGDNEACRLVKPEHPRVQSGDCCPLSRTRTTEREGRTYLLRPTASTVIVNFLRQAGRARKGAKAPPQNGRYRCARTDHRAGTGLWATELRRPPRLRPASSALVDGLRS